jgi:hypothetical protein
MNVAFERFAPANIELPRRPMAAAIAESLRSIRRPAPPMPLLPHEVPKPPEEPPPRAWTQPLARAPQSTAPATRVRFRPASEIARSARPPQWLARGFVETDSLAVIAGDPGTGKSFAALDLAFCVATAQPFHGMSVESGPALIIAGEGAAGIGRRLRALEIARSVRLEGSPLHISTQPAALTDPADARALEQVVRSFAAEHGPPKLIVFDTLARNLGPADENSNSDVSRAIAACDRLRAATGACVMLVHHLGHSAKDRPRGASALPAALDWCWLCERDEDGTIRAQCTKAKDHEIPPPLAFKLCTVELDMADEDGNAVTSAVLQRVDPPEAPRRVGRAARGPNIHRAIEVLRAEVERHRANVIASGRDPSCARVRLVTWRDAALRAGLERNRFHEVKQALERAGEIVVDGEFVALRDDL